MAPVVPGFTTDRRRLEATIRAIADHGAAFMGANLLYLKDGTKDHFMGFLRQEFPHLVEGYERLYPGCLRAAKATSQARRRDSSTDLRQRYAVGARPFRHGDEKHPAEAEPAIAPERRRQDVRLELSRYAVAASDGRRHASIAMRPFCTVAVNLPPSFQRWLIGSLMRASIARFRNRAPYARL